MTSAGIWQIHIDGAARGNPGPAAFAFILKKEGSQAIEEKGLLGVTTNNLAEYSALVRALERAAELGARRLLVYSDSELLVKQMNGQYRVKNHDLREMYDRAKEMIERFDKVEIRHLRREQNSRADELCNQALDGDIQIEKSVNRKGTLTPAGNNAPERIRQKAIAQLQSAAERWSKGEVQSPTPEEVWEQIWQLLEENRIIHCPFEG